MARNKTTFGKLRCSKCGHKSADCYCIPADNETIVLPGGKVERVADIQRGYLSQQMKSGQAAHEGRYIPKVKIAKPKIEHDLRSNRKAAQKSKPPTAQKRQLCRVEHKSTKGGEKKAHGRALFKGGGLA